MADTTWALGRGTQESLKVMIRAVSLISKSQESSRRQLYRQSPQTAFFPVVFIRKCVGGEGANSHRDQRHPPSGQQPQAEGPPCGTSRDVPRDSFGAC